MATHTPGPWDNYDGVIGAFIEGRHSWTPVAMAAEDEEYRDECVPNGHLIAAAPEMLRVLKLAEGRLSLLLCAYTEQHDDCDHPVATRHVLKWVSEAIAKAEGRSLPTLPETTDTRAKP